MTRRLDNEARRAIRELVKEQAAARHGIFRRSDLQALDIDPGIVRSFMSRHWWMRLHHGVYVDTDVYAAAIDPIARTRLLASAAMAAIPGPAYAFGPSAALLQGIVVDRHLTGSVSIVRPVELDQRALRRRVTGSTELKEVTIHRHALQDAHLTVVDGIPSVDRATAALTTAARSTLMWAVATLDSLVWQDPDTLDRLPTLIDEWPGLRGLGVVREAAGLARDGAQTALESISRFNLMEQGLAEPRLQVAFHDASGLIGYADMVWDDLRVIGEADGLGKYQSRSDLIAEKRREDRLRALGWIVVRWTWEEVFRNPRAVAERIRRAAIQARLSSAHIA